MAARDVGLFVQGLSKKVRSLSDPVAARAAAQRGYDQVQKAFSRTSTQVREHWYQVTLDAAYELVAREHGLTVDKVKAALTQTASSQPVGCER